jgi:hypothetical protein
MGWWDFRGLELNVNLNLSQGSPRKNTSRYQVRVDAEPIFMPVAIATANPRRRRNGVKIRIAEF